MAPLCLSRVACVSESTIACAASAGWRSCSTDCDKAAIAVHGHVRSADAFGRNAGAEHRRNVILAGDDRSVAEWTADMVTILNIASAPRTESVVPGRQKSTGRRIAS